MKKPPLAVAQVEPYAFTVQGFLEYYPSCRSSVYEDIRAGELASFLDGRRRLIPLEGERGAKAYAQRKREQAPQVSPELSRKRAEAGRLGRAVQLGSMATSDERTEAA